MHAKIVRCKSVALSICTAVTIASLCTVPFLFGVFACKRPIYAEKEHTRTVAFDRDDGVIELIEVEHSGALSVKCKGITFFANSGARLLAAVVTITPAQEGAGGGGGNDGHGFLGPAARS